VTATKPGIKLALILIPIPAFLLSLFIGRYQADPGTVLSVIASKIPFMEGNTFSTTLETAILWVRLPRIVLAMMVGMSLSISGAAFQGVFRNPLVSPQILGVANGAAFGAAFAILAGASILIVQIAAFVCGILSVAMTYSISRFYKSTPTLTLVLSGIVVGAFFAALVSLIKYSADPWDKLPAIVFWLMGSLAKSSVEDLMITVPPMALSIIALLLVRWRINVLSLGDEDARALGIDVEKLRLILILFCTLATSAAVCVAGVVGWVGLVIPHVGRMLVGPDHKVLLPATLSIGGVYLLLMDDLARTMTVAEIPLGILTAIVGAPFFAYLLRKGINWS
jgi:iron complex transport system permease protein